MFTRIAGFCFYLTLMLFQGHELVAQRRLGSAFIDHFKPKVYNAHPQNFSITEDKHGILYIGNNDGILEYDGEYWRLFFTENYSIVLEILNGPDDQMFYGGENEFGLILKDSIGRSFCKSLFYDEDGNSGDFRRVFSGENSVIAFSPFTMLLYSDLGMDTVFFDERMQTAFSMDNRLIVQSNRGELFEYYEGALKKIEIRGIESQSRLEKTILNGEFLMAENEIFKATQYGWQRLYTDVDYLIERSFILDVIPNSKGELWLSLRNEGLLLIDKNGRFLDYVGRRNGLVDLYVQGFHLDQFGALWLASFNGVMRMNLEIGLSVFSQREGLFGNIEALNFTKKGPIVGSSEGVYLINSSQSQYQSALTKDHTQVEPFAGIKMQAWYLIPHPSKGSHVLAAMNDGVYDLDLDKLSSDMIFECYPWTLFDDSINDLLFVGLDPGLAILDRNTLELEVDFKEVQSAITCIEQSSDGTLWLSGNGGSFYKLQVQKNDDEIEYALDDLYENTGLDNKNYRVLVNHDSVFLYSANGLYQYDVSRDTSVFIPFADVEDSSLYIHRANFDENGDLWLVAANLQNRKFIGRYSFQEKTFNYGMFEPVADAMPQLIIPKSSDEVWVGTNSGLFIYRESSFKPPKSFKSYIRQVRLNQSDTLSMGSNLSSNLDYTENDLDFRFSSMNVSEEGSNLYSYLLVGQSETWSEWSKVSEARFTNLESGQYRLMMKSKNLYGKESEEASFSFKINNPWYESGWYYLGQALFFLMLIIITYFFSRGSQSQYSEVLIIITVITLFEFVILFIEPYVDNYSNGVPIFKLAMNIALALSLHPMERLLRRVFNKKQA